MRGEIAAQPAMAEWAARELSPGLEAVTDEELGTTSARPTTPSTTRSARRMGPDDDQMAVRRPATAGARASPGCGWPTRSVMPNLSASTRTSPLMMIGEKCADMLIQDVQAAAPQSSAGVTSADRADGRPRSPTSCAITAVRRALRHGRAAPAAAAEVEVHGAGVTVFPQAPSPSGTCAWCVRGDRARPRRAAARPPRRRRALRAGVDALGPGHRGHGAGRGRDGLLPDPADVARDLLGRPEALPFVTRTLWPAGAWRSRSARRRDAPAHQPWRARAKALVNCEP